VSPGRSDEQLESVLGTTPHEFESRILRQCLTGHDVDGPHRLRWGPSAFVVAVSEVVSFGESAVADEGAGDACEGQEVVGLAFVSAVEAAAAGEPGHGSFDDPSVTSQVGRGLDPAPGDAMDDTSASEPLPQVAVVVSLVPMELPGLAASGSAARANRRYPAHERLQALAATGG